MTAICAQRASVGEQRVQIKRSATRSTSASGFGTYSEGIWQTPPRTSGMLDSSYWLSCRNSFLASRRTSMPVVALKDAKPDYRVHARKLFRENPRASVEQLAEIFYN